MSTEGNADAGVDDVDVCVVCGLDEDLTTSPECGHAICGECLKHHTNACIDTRRLPVQCAACDVEIPYRLLGTTLAREDMDRLDTALLRAALERDPQVRFCPYPDCGYAVFLADDMSHCPYARCDTCQRPFCTRCRSKAHGSELCTLANMPTTVKPCPKCFAPIEKDDDGSCNHVRCYVCKTDFCWLCLKPLSAMDTVNHYIGFTGCSMYGTKRWSEKKLRRVHLSSPLWMPLSIGAAAASVPFIALVLPYVAGREAFRDNMSASKPRRLWKGFRAGMTTLLFGTPFLGVLFAIASLRGVWFAYGKVPYRELRSLCGPRRSGDVDLTPQSALPANHRLLGLHGADPGGAEQATESTDATASHDIASTA